MDYLRQFVIPFSGLATGTHQFDFTIGKKFFECIEYSELSTAELKVKVNLDKEERMLSFDFHFEGFVEVDCDRCAEAFDLPVKGDDQLFIKFGDTFQEEDDHVMVIPYSEHQINLSHRIYEMIVLSIPYQHIHPLDEEGNSSCNPEQISKLQDYLSHTDNDPRWDKLKGLINDN